MSLNGEILYVLEKGLIILLENDFEGIIPISTVQNPDNYNIGNQITVKVITIDVEKKKITLDFDGISEENLNSKSDSDTEEPVDTEEPSDTQSDSETEESVDVEETSVTQSDSDTEEPVDVEKASDTQSDSDTGESVDVKETSDK